MISKKDISVGSRIIYNDSENPSSVNFKGTVQSINSTGEGEFDYTAAVLPDEEFRQLPGIKENCYFGLTICFSFDMDLLPMQRVIQDTSHIMKKFQINLQQHNDDTKAFYNELVPMLLAYGYEISANRTEWEAPEARKDKTRIYCHPLQLAGECPPTEFKQIEQMLCHGKTYEIHNIISEQMFDYTEAEELEQYHLQYDDIIPIMLLDAFRTKKSNDYKDTRQVIEIISKKIKIITIYNYLWSGDGSVSTKYVKAAYNTLLKDRKISINPNDIHQSRTEESI